MIGLGKIFLGSISLGRIGRLSKSGASLPLYKQILSKMPKELKESLACWYSPNLQGLTNAELYNSDNLYVGGLHDLSGNGHDMTLYGFDGVEGGGHVDEEGNLCFDGLNDYGSSGNNTILLTDYTVFLEASNPISNKCPQLMKGAREAASFSGTIIAINRLGYEAASFGTYTRVVNGSGSVVMTPTMYNNTSITRGTNVDRDIYVYTIGRYGSSIFTSMVFRCAVVFDHTLTDTEIDWVKTNMLVSQEPSKRNVTLWLVDEESGSFDKFKSMKVQNGNMIGKYDEDGNLILPVYDIGSIYQTSMAWYTDVDCTEEYIGEYITEDTFLYAKKVKTSDNMLAQLDNVVLEDGTTAREHLVCWYSPKLQGLTKESVLADAALVDLSGNGRNMELFGFDSDEECIDTDGALVYDGVDDYSSMYYYQATISEYAVIFDFELLDRTTRAQIAFCNATSSKEMYWYNTNAGIGVAGRTQISSVNVLRPSQEVTYLLQRKGNVSSVITPFESNTEEREYVSRSDYYVIARGRDPRQSSSSNARFCKMKLHAFIATDYFFTETEFQQIKTILKLQ